MFRAALKICRWFSRKNRALRAGHLTLSQERRLSLAMEPLEDRLVMSAAYSALFIDPIHITGHGSNIFAPSVNSAPSFTSPNSETFQAGFNGIFLVTTTGTPTATVTESGALPSGVTFHSGSGGVGVLSGTPAAGTGGDYTLDLTASNSVNPDATQTFGLEVIEDSAITSSNAANFTVGSSHSFTITTHGFPAPSIAETGSLPSGLSYVDNGDGTATISGTPANGTQGVYSLSLDAGNGIDSDATQTLTLTLGVPPSVTSANNVTFTTGSTASFSVTTTGYPTAAITETGGLPSGITLTDNGDGTGTLAGTPGASAGGSYAITLHGINGFAPDASQGFTITVDQAPAVTSGSTHTFTVGSAGSTTITITGYPDSTITESGSLPSGVTFTDNGDDTATLAGTPAAATGGTYTFTITSANGVGSDATQNYTLTIDQAPSITSANNSTFTVGSTASFAVTASGFPAPTYSETGALPSGITLNSTTGALSGTPATNTGGTYALTLTATNSVGSDATQSFTLTIDEAPSVSSTNHATFTVGSAGSDTITTTGFPIGAITESGSLPSGVTFMDNGDGTATLAGTPDAATGTTYAITLTATNGIGSDATQNFTLTVGQAPAITSANNATFTVGSAGSFTVTTTGFPATTITKSGSLPSGVTLTDNGDGTATLAGTPAASTGGTFTLTLTAANGVGSDATQSFTLTVDQAPAITSVNHTTFTVGSAGTYTITTTGFPTTAITKSGSLPSGVTLTDNGDGTATLAGTPAAATGGTFVITLTAANSVGSNATQSFTLTVHQAPAITSAATQSYAIGSGGHFIVHSTGFPTATITESGSLPSGVTFVDEGNGTAQINGTPAVGSGGVYVMTITASNGTSPNAMQTFTLTVYGAPTITNASSTNFIVGDAGSFTFHSTGYPVAALAEIGALPTGVTFTDNGDGTATLAGTPSGGQEGTYSLSIDAGNNIGTDAIQSFTLNVRLTPTITSANNTTFTTGSAGSFTVQTTGLPNAAITESGSLPSGVTLTDNGDGTATLAGTPDATTGGTYVITLNASNGFSPDGTQSFTLTVDQAPTVTSTNHTTFTVGSSGTYTITTAGFPVAAITKTGSLPSGVTLTDNGDGTATLAGTPAAATGGTYTITLHAANGVGSNGSQSFTLTVDQAPAITSVNNTTFTTGSAGSYTITTTGFPAAAITESGSLPSGVTLTDNGDGTATLAGTPDATTGGTYSITLTAANSVGSNDMQSFTLTIDQAPAITSTNHTTFTVGSSGSYTITTTGFPTTAITKSGSLPSGVTLTDNGDGTATLAGTPDAATGGTFTITLTAANGIGSDATQSFTLTVDQALVITSADNTTFTVGSAGSFTITTTGFPNAAITESGDLPSGVTLTDNGDGTATLAGTPDAATGGTYSLTITASNSVVTDATQSFTLTIDQAPAITSTNHTTFTVGAAGSYTITTSGFPTTAITKSGSLPSGVTLTDNGDGTATLAGTPAAATGGTFTITLTATNGIGSDATQSFTLTVDQAPAITSVNHTTFTVGSAGSYTITTTGFPADAITKSGSLPSGVTLTDNGDGTATLAGTPAAATGGTYMITLTAADGVGSNATQSFTLTIDQAPAVTSANNTTFTVGAAGTFTITTSGFPAAAITESGSLPSGVTLTDNGDGTATLAGTPDAATGGTFAITLTAANGIGSDGTQSFTLTVDQAPAITSDNNTTFTVGSAGSYTITTTGFPAAAITESGSLPSGVTLTDNGDGTATLAGTPGASTGGTYVISLTAANGTSPDATQSFTLTVDQAPAVTSVNHATFTVGSAGSFTVTASGFPAPTFSESGALPSGVTLDSTTGVLSGTPAAGTGGTYAITITATNSIGSDATQSFTLTIDQAPTVSSVNHRTFTVGAAGSYTIITTGFPAAAITKSGSLPSGVTLTDNGDGTATLAGTPAAATGGIYVITLTAANGTSPNGTQSFTLTIDQAPTFTSPNTEAFQAGSPNTFVVHTTGFPVAAITMSGSLPSGVTLHDNGDGTATISGTPGATTGGIYMLTLTASNGTSPDGTQSFAFTVNQSPTYTSASSANFLVNNADTFTLTTLAFPTAVLSETGALPSGVTFTDNGDGTGTLAGTPAPGTSGVYGISFGATNVVNTANQAFTLTVGSVPAITSANTQTFTTGSSGTFTVTATGFPAPTFNETGALPTGVTFNGTTGVLAGTPAAGTGGSYNISLTATNVFGTTSAQSFALVVDQAPAVTSANNTTFTVGSAGTFTITTTGFPTNSITKTGSLPSGVTLTDNGDGTATLAGTPAAATGAIYSITITAANGVGSNATQTLFLTIDQAPAITSGSSTTFTTGSTGTFSVTSTGFPAATYSESGSLPSGVSLNSTTGVLSGTPASGTGGTYAITLTAANGVGSNATQSFTLTIDQAPSITSVNNTTFTVGSAGTYTITTTGFPTNAITKSGSLPSGVTLTDNGDGTATLAGTPAAATGGTYTLTLTAANGIGSNATQSFTLTIDQAPSITSVNNTTFAVGSAGTYTITTTGFPTNSITETGSLPSGVTLTDNGDGTATLAGTPAAATGGTYTLTLTAANGVGSNATQSFTLTVDQVPAITSVNNTTFTVGSAGTYTITTTGFPTNAITETGSLPSGVTLTDNGDGTATLAGTPAASSGGTYTLTLTAANGVGSNATQSFTLTVDQAPAITSVNNTTFTVGSAGTYTITTTGFPTNAITETGSLPSGVTLTDNGDGTATLAGTPAAAMGGTYTLTLTAANGVGSNATQSFTLTVNQAPFITSVNNTTFTVGSAGTYTITTTGFPTNAITKTGSLPSGVTLTDNGNGTATLAGTPAGATGGIYSFTITAANGVGSNATQSFTLTVDQAPAITSADHTTFTVGTAGTYTVITTGFPINAITESGSLPSGVTLTDNGDGTATLAGTPAALSGGTFTLTLTAANGVGSNATQTFTLTVDQAPAITSVNHTTFTVGSASSYTVITTGFPTDAIIETGSLPSGVTFTDNGDNTGTFAGTPDATTGGTYTITITAADRVGTNATQTFSLTVFEAPSITSANNTTFTTGSAGSFTVTSTGFPSITYHATGTLPSGVSLDSSTGIFSGTPEAGAGGTYNVTITLSNGVSPNATQAFTLTVDQAPAITSTASTTFVAGAFGTFTVSTTGFPTNAITKSGSLPLGVTLTDNGDGTATLAGTPMNFTGGNYNLTLTAANGVGTNATQSFTLTVNQAPTINSDDQATFIAGSAGSFTVTSSGVPSATYSDDDSLPDGLTLNSTTGVISGTPSVGTGGTYEVNLTATNGVSPDATQLFVLTVDEAPAITTANHFTYTTGHAGTFTIRSSGFPASVMTEIGSVPSGLIFTDNGDGTATIAGTANSGSGGTVVLALDANNGVGSDATQAFTLTVQQAPVISSTDHATFHTGAAGTFTVSTTDFPIAVVSESGLLPSGVTFVDNHDGTATLSGTPGASAGGTYVLSIGAVNGVTPDATQNFTLTVDQATAFTSSNHATFTTGTAGTFTISTTGFPIAAVTESGGLPGGVTFTDNHDGTATIAGTPGASAGASYALTLTGNNGLGANATQSFTLTVDQAPAFTSVSSATFTTGTAGSITITTTGFPTNTITETGALPGGVTFTDNHNGTATLSGTPAALSGGSYVLSLSASTGVGSAATQAFTLTVHQAEAFTNASSVSFNGGVSSKFKVRTSGFPVAAITESGTLPSGLTFVDAHNGVATLAGTPADNSGGVYTLTITAVNGVGGSVMQNFTLTIVAPPTIVVGNQNGTVVVSYPDGSTALQLTPFPGGHATQSRVATADFNGDGTPDIIVGGGVGGVPRVKIFDGKTGSLITSFLAFGNTYLGGIFVAAGDVNGDGTPDIIVGQGGGVISRVHIYNGKTFAQIADFQPYANAYTGGVAVASADFNNDGHADVVTIQNGGGQRPQIEIFSGSAILLGTQTLLGTANPFQSTYTGGAFIATGDVNDDGTPDLIASETTGGQPLVRVVDGHTLTRIQSFLAFGSSFAGGVAVASGDFNNDGFADIVAASGPGMSLVTIFSGKDNSVLFSFTPSGGGLGGLRVA